MKVTSQVKTICELSEIQKLVIKNDISKEIFEEDMVRRLKWIVEKPCDQCYEYQKKSWHSILQANGEHSVPLEKIALADRVFKYNHMKLPEGQDSDLSISIDGREVFRVTPTQKKMISLQGNKDPDDFCHSQMQWILSHKYQRCMERLRKEWESKLSIRGISSLPIDDDEFARLVFSQQDYQDRAQRERALFQKK